MSSIHFFIKWQCWCKVLCLINCNHEKKKFFFQFFWWKDLSILVISSASNLKPHLVLDFSHSRSFWLVLLSSQLLCWYHSASYCLFLILIPLTILHFFCALSHYLICYFKLFAFFSIWFFIIDIYFTIYLLINSFLILHKHSVDLILVHRGFS